MLFPKQVFLICGRVNLRTTVMLIAIAEFVGSLFSMFVLALCDCHARDMAAKLDADIMEDAEREIIVMDGDESNDYASPTTTINELRFNDAKSLVNYITAGVSVALVFYASCCFASILLGLGVYLRNRILILSWLVISAVCLIVFHTTTFLAVNFFARPDLRALSNILLFIILCVLVYAFTIVHSYYKLLQSQKAPQISNANIINLVVSKGGAQVANV
ncbi:unnamed protein product [Bemisia tabaci]|uniref:Uncharacterized protein n=1 Tax=Bemisia tabaci TaxID=7038 RepID=A0A9P0ADA8_BEMTA|nr:unnamed protein product [Bemisia tabaci]